MPTHDPAQSATTDGLTISPALDLVAESAQIPQQHVLVDLRVLRLCGLSILIGVVASFAAKLLIGLIALITNIAFFGTFSLADAVPGDAVHGLGLWVIPIPIIGEYVGRIYHELKRRSLYVVDEVLGFQKEVPKRGV